MVFCISHLQWNTNPFHEKVTPLIAPSSPTTPALSPQEEETVLLDIGGEDFRVAKAALSREGVRRRRVSPPPPWVSRGRGVGVRWCLEGCESPSQASPSCPNGCIQFPLTDSHGWQTRCWGCDRNNIAVLGSGAFWMPPLLRHPEPTTLAFFSQGCFEV